MQMYLREPLLDTPHQLLIPLQLQIRMQAALHQHTCPTHFHRLADFFVDGFQVQHVALGPSWALDRGVKGAEGTVLGAKVGVVNVAIDDVGNYTFRVQLVAQRIGFHADSDQIIRTKQL